MKRYLHLENCQPTTALESCIHDLTARFNATAKQKYFLDIRSYLSLDKDTIHTLSYNRSEALTVVIKPEITNVVSSKQFQLLLQKDKQYTPKSQSISIDGFELVLNDWVLRIGNIILNNNTFKGLLAEVVYLSDDDDLRLTEELQAVLFPAFKPISTDLLNYFKSISFI